MTSTSSSRPGGRIWPVLTTAFLLSSIWIQPALADSTLGQVGDTVAAYFPERNDPSNYWYKSTILGIGPFGYHIRYEDDEREFYQVRRERLKPYVPPKEGDEVQVLFDPIDNVIGDWGDAKVVSVNRDGTYNVVVTAYDTVLEYVTDAELRRVEKKERRKRKKS